MSIQFIVPEPKRLMPRDYLGDSVYATFDGHGIILTTENGGPFPPSNHIYLEPEVYAALLRFVERVKTQPAPPPPPAAADHPTSADGTTATSADPS